MASKEEITLQFKDIFPETEKQQKYWQALGRFIDMISVTETLMNSVVMKYAKVDLPTAKALFMPTRMHEAFTYLR